MKEYIGRIKSGAKVWEICMWWVFRLPMIYALIVGFMSKPFKLSEPLQVFANLVGMFAWEIFMACPKKTFFRHLPSYIQDGSVIMILCASFGGQFLGFYYKIQMWDSVMHLTSGALCVILGYEIMTAMQKRDRKPCSLSILLLGALSFSFFVSTCWELFEFTADQVMCAQGGIGDAQHWCWALAEGTPKAKTLIDPIYQARWPIMDTMIDIILNTIGAIAAWIALKIIPYHHKGKNNVNTIIENELVKEVEEKDKKLITK